MSEVNQWMMDAMNFLRAVYEPAMMSGDADRARLANDAHEHSQRLGGALAVASGDSEETASAMGHELFRFAEAFFLLGRLSYDGSEEQRQADMATAAVIKKYGKLN